MRFQKLLEFWIFLEIGNIFFFSLRMGFKFQLRSIEVYAVKDCIEDEDSRSKNRTSLILE